MKAHIFSYSEIFKKKKWTRALVCAYVPGRYRQFTHWDM